MQKDNSMKQDILDSIARGKASSKGGFTVPDGYFDGLQRRVMDALPAEGAMTVALPRSRRKPSLSRWLAAAAVACAFIGGGYAYFHAAAPEAAAPASARAVATVAANDSYIDQVADYTMMDNDDIYKYLASGDY